MILEKTIFPSTLFFMIFDIQKSHKSVIYTIYLYILIEFETLIENYLSFAVLFMYKLSCHYLSVFFTKKCIYFLTEKCDIYEKYTHWNVKTEHWR